MTTAEIDLPKAVRPSIAEMPEQRIGAVAMTAINDPDVIPLWFGESDMATPQFIQDAAVTAMQAGHTRYVSRRGVTPFREAIRDYTKFLWNIDLGLERISCTGSGMTSIMIAMQTLVDAGDNVVFVAPTWPNAYYAVDVLGGESRFVPLSLTETGFKLDLDQLFDACDDRTKALFVNSPSNPSGWMIEHDQMRDIMAFARSRGIAVISDEVYHRLVYDRRVAPSFLEVAEPEDALFVIHSMSKGWAMTGWRAGWIISPASLGDKMGELSVLNNTGAASFIQHASAVALREGENFVAEMVDRCRRGRDLVFQRLSAMDRVRMTRPEGAFYAFPKIEGMSDDLEFAKRLVKEARVGLAPGSAFGPLHDGYLRLCFARGEADMSVAMDRLEQALSR